MNISRDLWIVRQENLKCVARFKKNPNYCGTVSKIRIKMRPVVYTTTYKHFRKHRIHYLLTPYIIVVSSDFGIV